MPVGPAGTYGATVPVRFAGSRRFPAPGQCRWGLSVNHCLLACVQAQYSQLYLLLFEPEQVGMNGVLFLHATSIARASRRDSVDLRHVVPRYGLVTFLEGRDVM